MRTKRMVQIGRNDKCPCGSDKKYKKCCLLSDHDKLLKQREIRRIAEDACKQKSEGEEETKEAI